MHWIHLLLVHMELSYFTSRLMLTSLGVLPNLGFIQGDGDEADKCILQVVLDDSKKEMTTCDWLVFPGRGGACSEMWVPGVERSSQHVPSQISFLILFSCWHLHWSLPNSWDHGGIHFHEELPQASSFLEETLSNQVSPPNSQGLSLRW